MGHVDDTRAFNVVLVDGLFGMGLNAGVTRYLEARFPGARMIKMRCGGVSSVRDRAIECFHQLRSDAPQHGAC